MSTIDRYLTAQEDEQPELNLGKTPEELEEDDEAREREEEELARETQATMREYWVNIPVRVWLPAEFETEATFVISEMINKEGEREGRTSFYDALRSVIETFGGDDPRKQKIVDILEYGSSEYVRNRGGYSFHPPELTQ